MKIAFFSDIHGNEYAYQSFLQQIKEYEIDQIVFLGDIFGYYYGQKNIIDSFITNQTVALLGNHDQYFLDIIDHRIDVNELIMKYGNSYLNIAERIPDYQINYMRKLPRDYEIKYKNIRIGLYHGSPVDFLNGRVYPDTKILEYEKYNQYNYLILGHTHHKMVRKAEKSFIINPGSLGQQRDGMGCSYIIFDLDSEQFEFKEVTFDKDKLKLDIQKNDPGNNKLIEVLYRKANYEKEDNNFWYEPIR